VVRAEKESFPCPVRAQATPGGREWEAENSPKVYLPCFPYLHEITCPSFLVFSWHVNNGNQISSSSFLHRNLKQVLIKMPDFKFPVASHCCILQVTKGRGREDQ
jgi:hypothetical protein